jgi:hypothetical protein
MTKSLLTDAPERRLRCLAQKHSQRAGSTAAPKHRQHSFIFFSPRLANRNVSNKEWVELQEECKVVSPLKPNYSGRTEKYQQQTPREEEEEEDEEEEDSERRHRSNDSESDREVRVRAKKTRTGRRGAYD